MTGILCALPVIGAPTASAPASALSVSLNRTSVSGSSTAASITTNSVTATGSNGNSPYTYSWSRVSGDSAISATSSSSNRTSFTRTGCVAGTAYSATWRCTVTDDDGNVAYSDNVSITITCTSSGGGGGGGGGGGTGGGTFNGVANTTVEAINQASTQTATFAINSNGTYTGGTWNSDSTVGASYEVKATMISGAVTAGFVGSWLALSANRTWALTDSTQNDVQSQCSFTLQIRQVGTTTVLDSATITLTANALSTL